MCHYFPENDNTPLSNISFEECSPKYIPPMEEEPINLCGPPPATFTETKLAEPILDWIRKEKETAEVQISEILANLEYKTRTKIQAINLIEVPACQSKDVRLMLITLTL